MNTVKFYSEANTFVAEMHYWVVGYRIYRIIDIQGYIT